MNNPYFSIIIPTLNEEHYVFGLLEALKNQVYRDFEVIIVDGMSEDNTIGIAQRYSSSFPLKIIKSNKQNVGSQRNKGAVYARGYYLIFFDADTSISNDYLFTLNQKLQKKKADFATTRFITKSKHLIDKWSISFVNILFYFLLQIGIPYMSGTNLIFRKKCFAKIRGFDASLTHAEDLEIVRRTAKQGYKGVYFYSLFHNISLRRIEREGRLSVWKKYILSFFLNLFNKKIKKPIFEYEMGGNV